MVDPRASRFWLAALQSGLLETQALSACWEGIPPEKRNAPEHLDRRLARQAVQQGHLTLWQAQQLLAGRTSGFRVDRYLLLDLIGHGGMGRVYLARDTRLGRQVALKILAPERMSNPRAIARFQREARVGAQLQHENLVRIYDFGESQGRYFLVMEYIEGKTIGALIFEQGPMPPATAARLTRQIALGLEHAHRKGLIHRDVNPYNILVTHEGIAKLADLGLAIDLAEEERVTREGATVGTFDYVAPEQARHSHSADIRSDIYSLGCSLYHMIAGQVPFPSPSLPEKLFAHQALEPTPLGEVIADIPDGLVEVVRRMMRKKPEERYATPLQVAQALEPFVEEYARIRDSQPEPSPLIADGLPADEAAAPPHSAEVGAAELSPALARASASHANGPAGPPKGAEAAQVAAPTILTPVNDQEVNSAEDVPLILDLGPEPSLSDSLPRAKPWFGPDRGGGLPGGAGAGPAGNPQRLRSAFEDLIARHPWIWPWGVVALVLAVALLAVALLAIGLLRPRTLGSDPVRRPSARPGVRARAEAIPGPDAATLEDSRATDPAGPRSTPRSDITVLGQDGRETPAMDLRDAISQAIGVRGWVVFRNREPLRLPGFSDTAAAVTGGWLKLRSAEGHRAVLEVEFKAGKPVLTTGSSLNLLIDGLTILARPPGPGPTASAPAPAPLILAAGKVQLRHCTFAVEAQGRPMPAPTQAIVADGGELTVESCWFRGFDTALVVRAVAGTTTRIQQTLADAGEVAPAGSPAAKDWILRVEFMPGGQAGSPRRLVLDHCTVAGDGFLKLAGFSLGAPIQVEATGCAVQARTLLGWEPATPGASLDARTLQWQGKGNQFDVRGPSWVEAVGAAGPTGTIGSLERWSQLVTESEPIAGPIVFPARPASRRDAPEPADFAVSAPGPLKPGADPAQVGPRPERPGSSP
jgi:serine/threonine-protein kinase